MNYRNTSASAIFMVLLALVFVPFMPLMAQRGKQAPVLSDTLKSSTFSGLKWRGIGPAFTSGRVSTIAVNPENFSEYYVGAGSGHVWKTVNNGTTFTPIFDNYGAYAIGFIAIDPNNSNVVWVGTGENTHQRALGYGNGVYRSDDGGLSWKNMGLKESRQIGKIVIDPRNSDVVYVAAEGSVWGPGGDRGLYKTSDGGKTWERVLFISENTGVNHITMDPRNPDVLYATSEQRRRHFFTKIGGGPESAVYKTTDAGKTWNKLTNGLPSGHVGGGSIEVSPANPDIVYFIVEAADGKGGFYRSTNKGASWSRMSDYTSSGQYFNIIVPDPVNPDKVFALDVVSKVTYDGGRTWKNLGLNKRHVDDHCLWI
ncbi:MAG TPA: YCF48-related protein, partial [Bacteroidales bacterium]|nr:YCF48-related protein [Bacteroidales bacterium]